MKRINVHSRLNEFTLHEAFKTCNPKDTAIIKKVYQQLTFPESVRDYKSDRQVPYEYNIFHQLPLVAVHAQMTSLTVDVKQAEWIIVNHFLGKVSP